MLKLPVVGDILFNSIIARFARTLAITFSAGVPIVDALQSLAGAAGNQLYANAIMEVREEVMTGIQLQQAIKSRKLFPERLLDNLTGLLEPLIMAVLGVLVGGLLIAMYLPIFQLGNVV